VQQSLCPQSMSACSKSLRLCLDSEFTPDSIRSIQTQPHDHRGWKRQPCGRVRISNATLASLTIHWPLSVTSYFKRDVFFNELKRYRSIQRYRFPNSRSLFTRRLKVHRST
jgi:hypothetical protein